MKKEIILYSGTDFLGGKIRDVEVYSSPVEIGGKKYLTSFIHDITERKDMENKLKASEERGAIAESFARYGNWVLNMNNGNFTGSEGAKKIFGYEDDVFTIAEVYEVILPEYREMIDSALRELVSSDIHYNIRYKIKRKTDGRIIDIASTARYDHDKNTVFGIIQDITEETAAYDLLYFRTSIFLSVLFIILFIQFVVIVFYIRANNMKKAAQATLVEKSREFDRFFSLKSDILCVFDKNGCLIKINEACENLMGVSMEDAVESDIYSYIDTDDRDKFSAALQAITEDGDTSTSEVAVISNDNGKRYVEWNISRDSGFFYGVARDVTERRINAEKRLKMEKQILQTQKLESLGVLAGGIAHDFNKILMAVLGYTELARMEISSASPAYGNLREIEAASKKASRLCSQMLAYTGCASYNLEKVNINKLINEMIHLVKTLITKKAVLNLSLEENISAIDADPSQISQVIMNLIINSSDAIGESNGVISISTGSSFFDVDYLSKTTTYENPEPGKYVYFEISDTGCGISSGEVERVFEPFYTTKFTGRGLGLAAVQGIVRSHKGSIKVYSEEGKGTNFKVMFPEADNGKKISEPDENGEKSSWKGSGTVLFVDDEDTLRFLGSDMLKKLGYNVVTAIDGSDAVRKYRELKSEIDFVILDLTMPNMDGSQALSEIRNINNDVDVIVASGYSYNDIVARFSGKNISGIIQKPYSMDKIREILENI